MVLKVRSCLPEPCPFVGFPVPFPAQFQALSPDGHYVIVGVNRDTERYHSVFLEDRVRKTRRKLFSYDRHIALLWKSDSQHFAVTDFSSSDHSRCSIFSVDERLLPFKFWMCFPINCPKTPGKNRRLICVITPRMLRQHPRMDPWVFSMMFWEWQEWATQHNLSSKPALSV